MTDRERWEQRYRGEGPRPPGAPSAWVMEQALAVPAGALALDLAAGRGRHAAALARRGYRVVAVDIAESAARVARAAYAAAGTSGGAAWAVVADLGALPVRQGAADLVLVINYLDRALFPTLGALLRPGGRLIVETFTAEQRSLGRGPRDPAHLLRPGELLALVAPLTVVARHHGLVRDAAGERFVAGVAAVRR